MAKTRRPARQSPPRPAAAPAPDVGVTAPQATEQRPRGAGGPPPRRGVASIASGSRAAKTSASWHEARRAKQRRMYVTVGALGAAALALVVVLAVVANYLSPGVDLGTRVADEGRTHVPDTTTPQYHTYPPASGPHYDAPAPWGSLDATLPEGRFVHNLEHGGIAILYKCPDNCDAVKANVSQVYNQIPAEPQFHEVKVVATPYTRMDHPFAVLAWDYVHEMDTLDSQYVRQFYDAHVNKGPEVIP